MIGADLYDLIIYYDQINHEISFEPPRLTLTMLLSNEQQKESRSLAINYSRVAIKLCYRLGMVSPNLKGSNLKKCLVASSLFIWLCCLNSEGLCSVLY